MKKTNEEENMETDCGMIVWKDCTYHVVRSIEMKT